MHVCAAHLEDQAPPGLSNHHLQIQACDRSSWQMQTQHPASCFSTWLQHPCQGISAFTIAPHKLKSKHCCFTLSKHGNACRWQSLTLVQCTSCNRSASAYSFDVFAIAALCKTVNETACQLPKSLLVTLFSKHRSTCRIPKLRQQDLNL